MAGEHVLQVGDLFTTFEQLEAAIRTYEESNLINVYKRSSRSIENYKKRLQVEKVVSDQLRFAEIDYACIHGGKNFKSRGSGKRPKYSTFQLKCPALIKIRVSEDGLRLVVKELKENHNHQISEESYKHLPRQRCLDSPTREEVTNMLQVRANKKLIQEHVRRSTGQILSIKDLHNAAAATKRCRTEKNPRTKKKKEFCLTMDQACSASAAPAGLTVQVCFPGARAAVLDNLNRQREEGRLCDLSIQVQGHVFRAHRCVLAASSPYFHDQVLLKNVSTVSLPSFIDPVAFERVLSSAYSGQLSIVHDDIVKYITVASLLQMWHIVDKCNEIPRKPSAEVSPGEAAAHPGTVPRLDFHPSENENDDVGRVAGRTSGEMTKEKVPRDLGGSAPSSDMLHACPTMEGASESSCPASGRMQWQAGPWTQQEPRPQEGENGSHNKDDDDEEEDVDYGSTTEGTFGRDTYDEIEDGTGQVSQRPLVPASPDFTLAGSEMNWPSTSVGQGASLTPTSSRHLSPSSAAFPPSSSPPTPSSSSSVSLAGAPYSGKVHLCHCGKAFALQAMLTWHVKLQHPNLRPFDCPVCTKPFKMKHHLAKHLKTHGGLRLLWKESDLEGRFPPAPQLTTAADVEDGYSYGFDEGEAFLAAGGLVKVEEVDFHGEMEDGMGGLLGSVSGIVDELRAQSQSLDSHVFKEEGLDTFS